LVEARGKAWSEPEAEPTRKQVGEAVAACRSLRVSEKLARLREELRAVRAESASLGAENKGLAEANKKLREQAATARKQAEALQQEVEGLRAENKKLKRELAAAQRASKRPAPRFPRRKRKANPKKPGRKPGHAPAHRPIPDEVDETIDVALGACPCGGAVEEEGTTEQYEVDVPPIRPRWRKFINHTGHCKKCGRRVTSRHPEQTSTAKGAACVTFGPRVLGLSIEMKERVGVPYAKVARLLMLCFQLPVSTGGLARAAKRIAKRAEPTYGALVEYLRRSGVVHADETGWHIATASKKAWLWVFATPEGVTVYVIRLSRGADVPRAILGESFGGTVGADGWVVYKTLGCRIAHCIGHLLRRCATLLELQCDDAAVFPQHVKGLLQGALLLRAARDGVTEPVNARVWDDAVKGQERQLAELLAPVQTDPDNERFRKHLVAHKDEILVFLKNLEVAPTNNLAEREIRPAVIARKLSAGNRTEAGAHTHEVLATLTRTGDRGGVPFVELVPELLRSPGPLVLAPERFGLPAHVKPPPPAPEPAHAPAPRSPRLRLQSRRLRGIDRAHPPTAPPRAPE
jgi:transposase